MRVIVTMTCTQEYDVDDETERLELVSSIEDDPSSMLTEATEIEVTANEILGDEDEEGG
jgi:hypothetical protein